MVFAVLEGLQPLEWDCKEEGAEYWTVTWPYVNYTPGTKHVGGNLRPREDTTLLSDLASFLLVIANSPKTISVKLNDRHTAVVSSEGIKVGCQTFPLGVIDALVTAREEVLK